MKLAPIETSALKLWVQPKMSSRTVRFCETSERKDLVDRAAGESLHGHPCIHPCHHRRHRPVVLTTTSPLLFISVFCVNIGIATCVCRYSK